MATTSARKQVVLKRFDHPDEHRDFKGHGFINVLMFGGGKIVGRGEFQPGWRWSNDVKPLAGTHSCEVAHTGLCLKGSMMIRMDSGEEYRIQAGDAFEISPGHDAWVEGNENCELIDMVGAGRYAASDTAAGTEDVSEIPRTLVDGFNNRDFSKTLSVFSDEAEWLDVASQTVFRGKNGYLQFDEGWLNAFPDGKVEIINIIAQGDRVVVEYIGRGTHLGILQGPAGSIQPTGKHVQLPMCDVLQIQNGKIIRGHTYYDSATLLQQLMTETKTETETKTKAA